MTDTPQSRPITIKNRYTDEVMFTASPKAKTIKEALVEAVQARANLADANLANAYLANTYLANANLANANLAGANLADANLADANLAGAYLAGAYLAGAYLANAYLANANLANANLAGAYLAGANLADAYLANAYLANAKNVELVVARTRILPEGALIGWKKCRDGVIVKLRIPEDAKRSHAQGRKCRAEFADVLAVYGGNNQTARSQHDGSFVYRIGERVRPTEKFNEDWTQECACGIHFFITREEAEAY